MFQDFKNNIDYFLRSKTKFSRKNFVEKSESALFRNYLENLYTYDLLEQIFDVNYQDKISALDIGCKNWFYAKGEYSFFKNHCNSLSLHGVEIDAYRVYSNFYSRYEVAKFYTKDLQNCLYIPDNLLNIKHRYNYIVWILPFITKNPHVAWGLPQRFFEPEKLLNHAYNLLLNDGQMLIVNQGEKEADIQQKMLEKLKIKYERKGIVKSEFLQYKNDRYAFLIKK